MLYPYLHLLIRSFDKGNELGRDLAPQSLPKQWKIQIRNCLRLTSHPGTICALDYYSYGIRIRNCEETLLVTPILHFLISME